MVETAQPSTTQKPGPLSKVPVNAATKSVALVLLGLVVVYALWWPLGFPAWALNKATAWLPFGSYRLLAGPLLVGIAMFLLRRRLAKALKALESSKTVAKVDALLGAPLLRPVIPALAAIALFLLGWAALKWDWRTDAGLPLFDSQRFPLLVGLFTLLTLQYGPALQRRLLPFFHARDKLHVWLRIGACALLAILVAQWLSGFGETRGDKAGLREQVVVLVSLAAGWLLVNPLAPRLAAPKGTLAPRPAGSPAPVPPPTKVNA